MEETKMMKEITIEDIIKSQMKFHLEDNFFGEDELESLLEGKKLAYMEILEDIKILSQGEFIEKYLGKLKESKKYFEALCGEEVENIEDEEWEKKEGYHNAIVNVLKVLNPIYEFDLEEEA